MAGESDPLGSILKNARGQVQLGGMTFRFGEQEQKPVLETMPLEQLERLEAELTGELKVIRAEMKRRKAK